MRLNNCTSSRLLLLAAFVAACAAPPLASGQNLLLNPGFESGYTANWTLETGSLNGEGLGESPRSGTKSWHGAWNWGGGAQITTYYQDVVASAGSVYTASMWCKANAWDGVYGNDTHRFRLTLEFRNASSALQTDQVTSGNPNDTYQNLTLVKTAPAGTTIARVKFSYITDQIAHAWKAWNIDDMSLTTPNAAPTQALSTQTGQWYKADDYYTITTTHTDINGFADVRECLLLIKKEVNGAAAAYFRCYAPGNQMWIVLDDGSNWKAGGAAAGTAGTVYENNQAYLDVTNSSVSKSGNTVTVNWRIAFKSTTYLGDHNIYLYTTDAAGATPGWQGPFGTASVVTKAATPFGANLLKNPGLEHGDTSFWTIDINSTSDAVNMVMNNGFGLGGVKAHGGNYFLASWNNPDFNASFGTYSYGGYQDVPVTAGVNYTFAYWFVGYRENASGTAPWTWSHIYWYNSSGALIGNGNYQVNSGSSYSLYYAGSGNHAYYNNYMLHAISGTAPVGAVTGRCYWRYSNDQTNSWRISAVDDFVMIPTLQYKDARPPTAPTLTATGGVQQTSLSWNSVGQPSSNFASTTDWTANTDNVTFNVSYLGETCVRVGGPAWKYFSSAQTFAAGTPQHIKVDLSCFSRNWRIPPSELHLYGFTRRRIVQCRESDGISVGLRR